MIYVVLPAFNEERVIRRLLLSIDRELVVRGVPTHVVVVDDGSTDATTAEAEAAVAETGGRLDLTILHHAQNMGLGAGLRTGIEWCLEHGSDDDVMVTMDADNTHPPAQIPDLVARLTPGIDIAIASRYEPGAIVRGVPRNRLWLSEIARRVMHLLFPIPGVRDYTCCFRAVRLSTLRKARLVYGEQLSTARGFEAVMDLLLRLRQLGIHGAEIPLDLDYSDRVGRSKMRLFRTIRRTLLLLARRYVERFTTWSPQAVARRLAAADGSVGSTPLDVGSTPLDVGSTAGSSES